MPAWFVVLMGMGTVFIGLTLIILLCKILSLFFKKNQDQPAAAEKNLFPAPVSEAAGPDRAVLDAVIVSAIAEISGKPIPAIKIVSIRKVS